MADPKKKSPVQEHSPMAGFFISMFKKIVEEILYLIVGKK